MIEVAREKFPKKAHPNVTFRAEDINDTALNGEFDAILCYSVFPHLTAPGRTVRHLARGLKPRGRLLIAHSESRLAINDMHRGLEEEVRGDFLPPVSELSSMMESAGLEVKESVDSDEMFVIMGCKP
jgi:demethylmenaquinone methyltransferase/2-methoxy-6-polyprenyl-1,4-benzoquinol methylase